MTWCSRFVCTFSHCCLILRCEQHAHAKAAESYWQKSTAAGATDPAAAAGTAFTSSSTAAASSTPQRDLLHTETVESLSNGPLAAAGDTPHRTVGTVASYWLMDEMAALGIKPDAYTYSFAISEVRTYTSAVQHVCCPAYHLQ
jgi:hypothetical protein